MAFAGLVSVFGEFLSDVVRYGDINVTFIVVPIQGNPTLYLSLPIFFHLVVEFEYIH